MASSSSSSPPGTAATAVVVAAGGAADPAVEHHQPAPSRRRLVKASSLNSAKREREAASATPPLPLKRSNSKGNEEQQHTPKHGRPPLNPAAPQDARPLGRQAQGMRPAAPALVKHGDELRIQQAKRAALVRAQSVGATGSFKSFDSPFGNYLLPVLPNQALAAKTVSRGSSSIAS